MTARREEAVSFHRDRALGVITLTRGDAANGIDRQLASDFRKAVIACEEDDAVRLVLIRAEGKIFCAGGDIQAFAAAGDEIGALIADLTDDLHDGLGRLSRLAKPVVTAVQGAAAGAGVGIALAGDLVIAARSASFRMAYPAIGMTPDGGATWMLPRLVGLRRAFEMALLNSKVTAAEAETLGLITRVVEDDALESAVADIVAQLSSSSLRALGMTRRLIGEALDRDYETHMRAEAKAIADAAVAGDGAEGIAAFLARRPPRYG